MKKDPDSPYTVAQALAIVFGAPPFTSEYPTEEIRQVLSGLLGRALASEEVLQALNQVPFAIARQRKKKKILVWHFTHVPATWQ
ncbi:hypothetical protein K3G63_04855 [Hymenobacter sp. HSC-4F20]|uniref:hypothetical protein n=1 Tax=Hymenobacter sp. HSC-4F20 TaxID=2864135 RepID=UPI001C7377BF|nr:hypothetical protein [Hymenobacter sp. HSC-4F20]MBX0289754.1 hypothetical protein [Hymenobacter sp. HSC-4F20]